MRHLAHRRDGNEARCRRPPPGSGSFTRTTFTRYIVPKHGGGSCAGGAGLGINQSIEFGLFSSRQRGAAVARGTPAGHEFRFLTQVLRPFGVNLNLKFARTTPGL